MYMAPETLRHAAGAGRYADGVNSKNDVWALGLIFYEMLFGHMPRSIANSGSMSALQRNIIGFKIQSDPKYMKMSSDEKELFRKMLEPQPRDRWSAAEALSKATGMAEQVGAQLSQQAGGTGLPECWSGVDKGPGLAPPVIPREPAKVRPEQARPVIPKGPGKEQPAQARPAQVRPVIPKEPGKNQPAQGRPDQVRPIKDADDEGEIIFLTFTNPMTNMKVNMLKNSWDENGVIKIPPSARPYSHSGLKNGDVIEEIAGVAFSDITESNWNLIKEGAFGAVKNAPLVVKLRRNR